MQKWQKWLYMGIIICSLLSMAISTVFAAEGTDDVYEPSEEEWDAMNVNLWFESLDVDSLTIDRNNLPTVLAEPTISIGNGSNLGMVYMDMNYNSGMTGLGPDYLENPDPWNYREYYESLMGAFRRVYDTGFGEWRSYSDLVGSSTRYAMIRWLKTGSDYCQSIYCIERGVDMDDSYTLTIEYSSVNDYVNILNSVNPQGWEGIQIASMFGCSVERYTAGPSYKILNTVTLDDPTFPIQTPDNTWQAHWWIDWYMATNQIYWEFQQGIRALRNDPGGAFVIDENGYRSDAKESLSARGWEVTFLRDELDGTYARDIYDWMIDKIYGFATIPSYSVNKTSSSTIPTYTLTWNNSRNRYETIVSETNGVDLNHISISGVNIEPVSGTAGQYYLYTTMATTGKTCEGTTTVGAALPTEAQPLFALDAGYDSWGNKVQTMMIGQAEITPPEFVFNIKTKELTGTISGKKISNGGKVLKGAVFGLYANSTATGKVIQTATSNSNGQFLFSDIPYGKYYVKEITAPTGYQLDSTIYSVEINVNAQSVTVGNGSLINYPSTAQVKVSKSSEDGKLAGFTFKISGTSDLGNSVSMTAVTNSSGIADFGQVELGTYKVEEILSSEQKGIYNTPNSQNITLGKAGEVKSLQFSNTLKRGTIKGKKVNDQEAVMTGVVFSLYKSDGITWVADATTDSNGIFTFSNVIYGTYIVKEKTTLSYYGLIATNYKVTVSDTAGTVWVNGGSNIVNNPATGTVVITKEINNKVQDFTNISLAGFAFKLSGTTALGRKYETNVTTTSNGTATINNVPVGTYTLTEIGSENGSLEAYIYKDMTVTVTANQTIRVTFTNTVVSACLNLKKVNGEDLSVKLKGAIFEVSKKRSDGTYEYYAAMRDNGDGTYTLEDLTVGDYQLKETKAPAYYNLESNIYYFSVKKENHGKDIIISALQASDGENVVKNTPEKGILIIEKEVEQDYFKTTDGKGFEFEVTGSFNIGGIKTWIVETTDIVEMKENKVVARAYVDDAGVYSGSYVITERETAKTEGFILPQSQTVIVNAEEEVVADFTGDYANKLMRGNVKLIKGDGEYPDIKLSGAVFQVYSKDGSISKVMIEDMNQPGTYNLTGLPFGEYYVKEIKAPDNYKINEEKYMFTIDADGETEIITSEGMSYLKNDPQIANLKLIKQLEKYESAESLEAISIDEVRFRITGMANTGQKIDLEVKIGESKEVTAQGHVIKVTGIKESEKTGCILIEGLRLGTYEITEIIDKSLYGYQTLDIDKHEIMLDSDGATVETVFTNKLRRGTITFLKHLAGEANIPVPGAVMRLEIKDYLNDWEESPSEEELNTDWLQDENGYYQWCSLGEVTTDQNGAAIFENLVVGMYKLIEVKAPDGYQLLADTIEFSLPYTESNRDDWSTELDETFVLGEQLIWTVPNSGGIGVMPFITLGMSLIIGSLSIVVKKYQKRM